MLQEMQHAPLGSLQEMQPSGPDVASSATSNDEGTRPPDEGTRRIVPRIRRFDERTQTFANEPGVPQVIDVKEDFAARSGSSRNARTRGAKVPDEPERRLLSRSAYGRNTIQKTLSRRGRRGVDGGAPEAGPSGMGRREGWPSWGGSAAVDARAEALLVALDACRLRLVEALRRGRDGGSGRRGSGRRPRGWRRSRRNPRRGCAGRAASPATR